jgi:prepilin-type N-terminal cleavage/methylation domain-containing protein
MINIKKNKGFTLIELLIIVAIIVIMSAVSFFSFNKNKENANLQVDAENLLLNIRKTQSMAMAVNSTGANNYQNGYGVFLTAVLGNPAGPQEIDPFSYIIFSDFENTPNGKNWDRAYLENNSVLSCGSPSYLVSECVEKITMGSGNYIASIELCNPSCSFNYTDSIYISFLRPNLDAYFCTIPPSSGGCTSASPAGHVRISIKSPQTGIERIISVWSTGQISIE